MQAEWNVWSGVVHVVALNALVHDAEPATDNSLAAAAHVVGKSETRTKCCPVIVDQAFGHAVLARDTDAVEIEWNACKDRIGAGTEAGAGSGAARISCLVSAAADAVIRVEGGRFGWVIKRGVEIPHAVVGFVGVRHTIPAQAEV